MVKKRILISNDKDFGERVHRLHQPHHGVILLRLEDESTDAAISVLQELLNHYADRLADSFIVVNEKTVRFARTTC